MIAAELEQLLRRLIREEIEAHEARRAAGDTSTIAHDDVAAIAAELATGARRARRKAGAR